MIIKYEAIGYKAYCFFIYKSNYNKNIRILNIGDGVAMGINSYGINDYSYADYYKEIINKNNKK